MLNLIAHTVLSFFLLIDKAIYGFSVIVYDLLILISKTNIFKQEIFTDFSSRVYALVGIFMLFKVSFSILNYIINPDDMSDKQKGMGKIVTNVVIVLVLIVLTPRIFSEAMEIQQLILSEDILGKLVLGGSPNDSICNQYSELGQPLPNDIICQRNAGDFIARETFSPFFRYTDQNNQEKNSLSETFSAAMDAIWDDTATYYILASTAAGVVLALVLLQYCFDVAIRAVKLVFFQLIAPVAIISLIDPKSSKDGLFKKGTKAAIKTYLDLFIRLLAIYFVIFIIGNISIKVPEGSGVAGSFAQALIILGALLFAKQLPNFLKELGINMSGGFTLNPMKRIAEAPVLGGVTSAAITKATGYAWNAANLGAGFISGKARELAGKVTGKEFESWDSNAALERARLRNKAYSVEAWSRIQSAGLKGNGNYSGPQGHDLYASSSSGDPERKGGLPGLISGRKNAAFREVQYHTFEQSDSDGVKSAKGIKATVSNAQNLVNTINNQASAKYQAAVTSGNTAQMQTYEQQMRADPSINYKDLAKGVARQYNDWVKNYNATAKPGVPKKQEIDAEHLANLNTDFSTYIANLANSINTEGKEIDQNGNVIGNFELKMIDKAGLAQSKATTIAELSQVMSMFAKASSDHLDKEMKSQKGAPPMPGGPKK